jgi:hypothetical protein
MRSWAGRPARACARASAKAAILGCMTRFRGEGGVPFRGGDGRARPAPPRLTRRGRIRRRGCRERPWRAESGDGERRSGGRARRIPSRRRDVRGGESGLGCCGRGARRMGGKRPVGSKARHAGTASSMAWTTVSEGPWRRRAGAASCRGRQPTCATAAAAPSRGWPSPSVGRAAPVGAPTEEESLAISTCGCRACGRA